MNKFSLATALMPPVAPDPKEILIPALKDGYSDDKCNVV